MTFMFFMLVRGGDLLYLKISSCLLCGFFFLYKGSGNFTVSTTSKDVNFIIILYSFPIVNIVIFKNGFSLVEIVLISGPDLGSGICFPVWCLCKRSLL